MTSNQGGRATGLRFLRGLLWGFFAGSVLMLALQWLGQLR